MRLSRNSMLIKIMPYSTVIAVEAVCEMVNSITGMYVWYIVYVCMVYSVCMYVCMYVWYRVCK